MRPLQAAKARAINLWHRSVADPKNSINGRAYDALDQFERDAEAIIAKWRNRGFWDRVFNREPR